MNMDQSHWLKAGATAAEPWRLAELGSTPRGRAGFRRGSLTGSSLEYKDFREYQPGDDLRHLDWNAYARTDRLIVKRYHEEITPHLDVLLDTSASMGLTESAKPAASLFLAAFFARVAANSGYTWRVWLVGEDCRPLERGNEPAHYWPELTFLEQTSPGKTLQKTRGRFRRHAQRVLISDLIWPGEPRPLISNLIGDAAGLMIVRILAERDENPPSGGKLRLVDSENGQFREVLVDPSTRERYLKRLNNHRQAWNNAARETASLLAEVNAEQFLERPQFEGPAFGQFLVM